MKANAKYPNRRRALKRQYKARQGDNAIINPCLSPVHYFHILQKRSAEHERLPVLRRGPNRTKSSLRIRGCLFAKSLVREPSKPRTNQDYVPASLKPSLIRQTITVTVRRLSCAVCTQHAMMSVCTSAADTRHRAGFSYTPYSHTSKSSRHRHDIWQQA